MKEISILVEKSATYMHSATVLVAEKDYESAVSRAYYAMFYLTQAVLSTRKTLSKLLLFLILT